MKRAVKQNFGSNFLSIIQLFATMGHFYNMKGMAIDRFKRATKY